MGLGRVGSLPLQSRDMLWTRVAVGQVHIPEPCQNGGRTARACSEPVSRVRLSGHVTLNVAALSWHRAHKPRSPQSKCF
jgi:hypothetical protein